MKFEHMKNIYFLLSASLLIASCGPTTVIQSDSYEPAPAPAPMADVSYQSFYDQLSPYGNWINYPGYGYVWMPNAGPDFQPYATNGNWIYTNAGWTWASDYSWGWAPFHYGRWFYENGYGWMWVPGNEWAPAWVSWRGGGDYYGWAPMGPRISVDVALSNYNPPANYWNFVPRQYMGNPNWHNYYVSGGRNVTIINNTTIINNYSGTNKSRYAYAPGPDPNEVRRYSGNKFKQVEIRESNTPGERYSGSQYTIYQPRVSNTPATRDNVSGRPAAAPARYESFNNVRPSAQYPSYNNQQANNNRPGSPNDANHQQDNYHPVNNQPVNNQPSNNQPANGTRPATQNPGYNQSDYNNRPANNQPANNQPSNNQPSNGSRPAPQNPGYSQPDNNNRPSNTPPANGNAKPQNALTNLPENNRPANNQPVQNDRTSADTRFERKPTAQPARPENTTAAQQNIQSAAQQHQGNKPPATGHPTNVHNPNNGHGTQKPPASDVKPMPKQVDQPKPKENGN